MNDHIPFEDHSFNPNSDYAKLVPWLQQIVKMPLAGEDKIPTAGENDTQLNLLLDSDYHLHFYQQLPNFVEALLTNDPQATVHYAPLLYHLAGCSECHSAYMDLYDAMRVASMPQESRSLLRQEKRTLPTIPQRMLKHLCQLLISQAEAVSSQIHQRPTNYEAIARAHLQLALKVSAHITQQNVRRKALHDLVRVATLTASLSDPKKDDPPAYVYTSTPMETDGRRTVRRADALSHSAELPPEQAIISLRSQSLEGNIVQHEQSLELHLQNLSAELRGCYVIISIPLGALIEPVRWAGGNPMAIRSTAPVDASGTLKMPLGKTALQLSNQEERNLLEAIFMLLKVYPADEVG